MKALLCWLTAFLLPLSAVADQVVFKNGRTMSGEIISETDTHVTISDSGLQLKLSKSKLSRIERAGVVSDPRVTAASAPATATLPATATPVASPPISATSDLVVSGNSFSLSSNNQVGSQAPPAFEGFIARIVELDTQRILASRAKADAQGNIKHLHQLESEIKQVTRQYESIMSSLKSQQGNPQAYNASVKRANELRVSTLNKQRQVETTKGKITQAQRTLNSYLNQSVQLIYQFQSMQEEHLRTHGDANGPYFDRMEARLKVHRKTFKEVTVPHKQYGNTLMVEVMINGKMQGAFIVDTGATFVTLHETMALQLGLPLDGPRMKTMLADGSIVEMPMVILDSVAVGEARAVQVNALVSKEKPAPNVDGLLGMAFLKNFNLVFDPLSGKLVLTSLR